MNPTPKLLFLKQYFTSNVNLTPAPSKKAWRAKPFMLRLQYAIAKRYWKKSKPHTYAKCVCSMIATAFTYTDFIFKVPHIGTITAHRPAAELTKSINTAIGLIASNQPIYSALPMTMYEMDIMDWKGEQDVTNHVYSHVLFFWTFLTACEELPEDGADKQNLAYFKASFETWLMYMENILDIHLAKK